MAISSLQEGSSSRLTGTECGEPAAATIPALSPLPFVWEGSAFSSREAQVWKARRQDRTPRMLENVSDADVRRFIEAKGARGGQSPGREKISST